jgi:hypothetical protein
MMNDDKDKKINLSGDLNFSLSGDDLKPKKQPTPQDAIDYLDSLDLRSRNALGARDVGRTISGLHNNKVSEMEGFDVVRRDKQFYAVYKEDGRETVMIPISPAKAASTLSARRELRQSARDKLEEKQKDLEYKTNLKKGLRAAGFDEEQAMGYGQMIDGMTSKDAGEFVKSLLLAKVRAANEIAETEKVTAEYNQRQRSNAAMNARNAFTTVPDARSKAEEVEAKEREGMVQSIDPKTGEITYTFEFSESRQREVDALRMQLGQIRAEQTMRERLVTSVEAFAVPQRGIDNRSFFATGLDRARSQGVSRQAVLVDPLSDLAEIMSLGEGSVGVTAEDQLALLERYSRAMTGRSLVAGPVEEQQFKDMLRDGGSASKRLRELLPALALMVADKAETTGSTPDPSRATPQGGGNAPSTPPPAPAEIPVNPVQSVLDELGSN